MRPADLHRVEKAVTHLDAAATVLGSIKWENETDIESAIKRHALEFIKEAQDCLKDIKHIQP